MNGTEGFVKRWNKPVWLRLSPKMGFPKACFAPELPNALIYIEMRVAC